MQKIKTISTFQGGIFKGLRRRWRQPKRKRHLLAVGLILLILLGPLTYFNLRNPQETKAGWWNDNWGYRKKLTIDNTGDADSDKKVKFDVDTAALITAGTMQSDCDDIRFTDTNGKLLRYYLDSGSGACNTSSSDYWILVETIHGNDDTILYMYYGNPSAASTVESAQFSQATFTPNSTSTGSEEVGPGPVAYWKFDEGADNTCSGGTNDACDQTSNDNDGAISGGTAWQTEDLCLAGKCLFFDGSDDIITVTNSNSIDFDRYLASGSTFQAWVRVNSDGENSTGEIFDKGDATSDFTYLRITNEGTDGLADLEASLALGTNGSTDDATKSITNGITLNQWHHVAMSYTDDGDDEITIYIDGQPQGSSTNGNGSPETADTNNLLIGGSSTANFHGFIDQFKIYDEERTADEIKTDFIKDASLHGSSAVFGDDTSFLSEGLLGYWKMDESSGGALNSSGSNAGLTNFSDATRTSGKFNQGGEFTPASSQHFLKSSSNLSGVKTLSFWVNPDSNTNYYMSLNNANIQSSGGTITTSGLSNPKVYVDGEPSTSISADSWQHVTVTTDTAIDDSTSVNVNSSNMGDVGSNSSIYCVSASDCKMAYYDATDTSLKFMDCDDATCTSGTINTLDGAQGCTLTGGDNCDTYPTDTDDTGWYPSLDCSAGATDCKIAYYNDTEQALFFADCGDATCSTGSMQMLDGDTTVTCALTGGDNCDTYPTDTDNAGLYPSLDCSAGATDCKITYFNNNEGALFFGDCGDASCSTGSMQLLDGDDTVTCALTGGDNCDTYPTDTDNTGYYSSLDCSAGATDCKIAYFNFSEWALFFADCDDATCSTGSMQMLDGDTTVTCALTGGDNCDTYPTDTDLAGYYPSLDCSAGATDCKIAYYNATEQALFFADCGDATCSTGSMQLLDGDDTVTCALTGGDNCDTYPTDTDLTGRYPSLDCSAGATDCKIVYYNQAEGALFFADCGDATCSTGSMQMLDGDDTVTCALSGGDGCNADIDVGNSLYSISLYCSAASDCKVSYYNSTSNTLLMGDCDDATCSSGSSQKLDGHDTEVGSYSSIYCVTASDCKMAYYDTTNTSLKFMDCDDATCTTGTINTLDGAEGCTLTGGDNCDTYPTDTDVTGMDPSLDCSAGATDCKIAYRNTTKGALFFADCDDATCSTGSIQMLDGDTTVTCALTGGDNCDTYPTDTDSTGQNPSLDCSAGATDCKIAYYNATEQALFFADCGDATCSSGSMQLLDGDNTVTCALTGGDNCDTYTDTNLTGVNPSLDCSAGATDCKIAYRNNTRTALFFGDCDDATCSSGSMQMLDGDTTFTCALTGGDNCDTYPTDTDSTGLYPSLDCSNGTTDCKIAYYNTTEDALFFADCDDATCSTGSMQMLDGDDTVACALTGGDNCNTYPTDTDNTGVYPSLDCSNGATDCKIAYYNFTEGALFFADCGDTACSSGNMQMLDGDDTVACALSSGDGCSADINAVNSINGLSLHCSAATDCKVSYYDATNYNLLMGDCGDASCSSGSSNLADGGLPTTLQLGKVGSNYFDGTMDEVRLYNREFTPAEIRQLADWAPGPVGYWNLNENTGTTAYDTSATGSSGTLTNMDATTDWVTGQFGGALEFDGSTGSSIEYVQIPNTASLKGLGKASISLWYKPNANPTGNAAIYYESTATGGYTRFAIFHNSNGDLVGVMRDTDSGSAFSATDTDPFTAGQWYHLALTLDADTDELNLYRDGGEVAENTTAKGTFTSGNPASDIAIGAYIDPTPANQYSVNGVVDDVKIFNYPLTRKQVWQERNAGHPAPGSPIGSSRGYWKFDENYGDTANDSSPENNDANLAGGTTCPQPGDSACPSWIAGKYDNALDFDTAGATDDYVVVPNTASFNGKTAGTISLWYNPDSNPSSNAAIYYESTTTDGYTRFAIYHLSNGDLQGAMRDTNSGSAFTVTETAPFTFGTWYYITLTVDSSTDELVLYLDGVEVERDAASKGAFTTGNPSNDISIGKYDSASTDYFVDGQIDEVKVFDFALTADQVKVDYNKASIASFGDVANQDNEGFGGNAPVGYWPLDENTDNTCNATDDACDISGNDNHGAKTSMTESDWVPGKVGSALDFDGSDDNVSVADDSVLQPGNGSWTASVWAKPPNSNQLGVMFSKRQNSGDLEQWTLAICGNSGCGTSGQLLVGIFRQSDTAYRSAISDNDIADGNWHHYAMVADKDADEVKLYVDGVEQGTTTTTNGVWPTLDNTDPLRIGDGNEVGRFTGSIDDARVYNYARTPSQIAYDYNRGKPVGYWKLDECEGTTINDSGSAGNNGTWSGSGGTNTSAGTCTGSSSEAWYNGAAGKRNASLDFDDTDDIITVTDDNALDLEDGLTIAAWVKTSANEADNVIVSKGTSYEMGINADGDVYWDGVGSAQDDASAKVLSGTWHHVVITNDDTTATYYIDGALSSSDSAGVDADNATALYIGYDGTNFFDGQIDDVRVYNYALTADQVKRVMNAGAVRFGPVTGSP